MDDLAERFRAWGKLAADLGSALYAQLAADVAEDDDMLALAAQKMAGQPPENMLFAAVHDLLLRGTPSPLRAYYPNLSDHPQPVAEAYPAFRSFCDSQRAAIVALLQTRRTQTNAVRRCTFLRPAFQYVAQQLEGRPFAQIEVGCSAGLNLHWDRFGYRYGDLASGNRDAAVVLQAALRGDGVPPLAVSPSVFGRIGIDLNPLDSNNEDDVTWLNALIWPEHAQRRDLLRGALTVAQQHPVTIVQGDAIAEIERLAARFPPELPLLVYHSFVMYQVSAEMQRQFLSRLDQIAQTRSLFCVDAGQQGTATPELQLYSWPNGIRNKLTLAEMDPHGRWLRWLV